MARYKKGDVFFFKQETAYEDRLSLVGSKMCIRGSHHRACNKSSADLLDAPAARAE